MRLFVALDLARGPGLEAIAGRLPRHFHTTLRFFGDLPDGSLGGLRRALDRTAGTTDAFDLELNGVGAFPSMERPQVVWVGFGRGRPEVDALAARLGSALLAEGFPADPRPFRAHATLYRVRSTADHAAAVRTLERGRSVSFGVQRVEEIVAYESRTDPSGADHHRLASATLRPPGASPGGSPP
jgi:2'-5' RNA ligase